MRPNDYMFLFRTLTLLFCVHLNAWAQQCNDKHPLSTPDEKFFINTNGTITELETGLTWMRCAVGQTWDGKNCNGKAKTFSWENAFKEEDRVNQGNGYAGLYNWHLPKLAELASIVERQCNSPRINLEIFPETPASAFWTANNKSGSQSQAFAMDFDKQGLLIMPQHSKLYLRLVSGRN